jgi:hypothetical protein
LTASKEAEQKFDVERFILRKLSELDVKKSIRLKGQVHTGIWRGNLWERGHFDDPSIDGMIILRWIFRKWDGAWTGLIWLRIGTGDSPRIQ